MLARTSSLGALIALALCLACDEASAPEYLPVGGGDVLELDRGTFTSSDPSILAVTTRDTSASVCSGIAPFGCSGQERTALRSVVTLRAVAEGRAEIQGTTQRDGELVLPYKVERIRSFEVFTVDPGVNDDPGTPLPEGEDLAVSRGTSAVLQINALGESNIPLGVVEPFEVTLVDGSVGSVRQGRYSRGWRATVTGAAVGSTSLQIATEWATRDIALAVR